jgi:hypothetical protein
VQFALSTHLDFSAGAILTTYDLLALVKRAEHALPRHFHVQVKHLQREDL